MIKHVCPCGYIYNTVYGDVTSDIEPGVSFKDLPENWLCPICGAPKLAFEEQNKRMKAKFISLK